MTNCPFAINQADMRDTIRLKRGQSKSSQIASILNWLCGNWLAFFVEKRRDNSRKSEYESIVVVKFKNNCGFRLGKFLLHIIINAFVSLWFGAVFSLWVRVLWMNRTTLFRHINTRSSHFFTFISLLLNAIAFSNFALSLDKNESVTLWMINDHIYGRTFTYKRKSHFIKERCLILNLG